MKDVFIHTLALIKLGNLSDENSVGRSSLKNVVGQNSMVHKGCINSNALDVCNELALVTFTT
jgi:hypothetical protein